MKIYGRDYGFKMTVGASVEISEMCPDGDIKNIGQLLEGRFSQVSRTGAEFICALSRGFEAAKSFEEPGYKPAPLTVELLMTLDQETFTETQLEAMRAFKNDKQGTVEAEPAKKNEEKSPNASS